MAGSKTQMTPRGVEEYIASIDQPARKKDCMELVTIIQEISGHPPVMWGSAIIGFGNYHYKYASGHEGDSFLIGLSARKNNFSVYLAPDIISDEVRLKHLGKVRAGKGCLYITSLDQVHRQALREFLADATAAIRERFGNTIA